MNTTTATIEHIVTDMGNGGSYCSYCKKDITYFLRDMTKHIVENGIRSQESGICPHCKSKFVGNNTFVSQGGSDF